MLRHFWILGGFVLPFGAETYHAACIAFDSANKTIYASDIFEQECGSQVAACRRDVTDKWTAFLRTESLAQSPGATRRCELYKDGSTPDESPRSRVRKWRDETIAQAQAGPIKYAKVVQTTFGFDEEGGR
ncbi:MAG: hypothetical protein ACT4P7_11070 [Gemmatimonadaceae bacterium]